MIMTLTVGLMSLFVLKNDIEAQYPGGLEGFRNRYPFRAEDDYLVSLGSMSGGEMQEFIDELCAAGLHPDRQVAIAEAFGGPSEICPGIVFEDLSPDNPFGGWIARAASEPESPKISGHA